LSCGPTAAELAQIQADVTSLVCDKTCSIYRKSRVSDGMGSATETWGLVETTVVGMVQPSSGLLSNYDYLIGSLSAWQLHFPVGIDVQYQDHVVVEGNTLEVHVVLEPRSYQAMLVVLAAEIK